MGHIAEYRKSKNMTLQELADKLSTSPGFLHDIEKGRRVPSALFSVKIEKITGIRREKLRPDIFVRGYVA